MGRFGNYSVWYKTHQTRVVWSQAACGQVNLFSDNVVERFRIQGLLQRV